jgi:hypothetical protein
LLLTSLENIPLHAPSNSQCLFNLLWGPVIIWA